MNVADSELITTLLIEQGFVAARDIDSAKIIIFNTCSVRQHAEDRVLGRISNEAKRKKSDPSIKIGVVGCMAQRIGEELIDRYKAIDFAVGVDQYDKLADILKAEVRLADTELNSQELYPHLTPMHQGKTNGFVTIMRGCNNFCSYCIVPYTRGRERSRKAEDIFADVVSAGKQGLKDITLLGQNVNSYLSDGISFPGLLQNLNEIEEIYRLRFITSHPKDLSDELISAIQGLDKVCEHIHLPMQSGSNRILHEMNRNYTFEHYRNQVQKLRNAIPDIAITTDIIAGFPTETDAEFRQTLSAVKDIGFDYAFCFKYSIRSGTKAADITDDLNEATRLGRLQELIDLQREITLCKFKAQIGKETEIYIEGRSKKNALQMSGSTRDFKIAVVDGDESQIGKLVLAKVIDATAGTLICEPLC